MRRWCLAVAALQLVQAVASWIWVVDTGQRLVSTGWALAAAVLGVLVFRVIPDSTERSPKTPTNRKRELTPSDWRELVVGALPVFIGMLMRDAIPGQPGFWVKNGVMLSAVLCAVAGYALVARRLRKRRNAGSS